jgi:hypothetical protein
VSVERTSDKRTGSYRLKTHLFSETFILLKLLRRDIPNDGKTISPWLKILADCQKITPRFSQILEEIKNLFSCLPESQHEA